jgi:hypothetical protein
MQRAVGGTVPTTMEPVAMSLAGARRDRRDPAQVRERHLAAEPLRVIARGGQELAGVVDAERVQLQQARCGTADQLGQPLVGEADLLVKLADAQGDRAQSRPEPMDRIGKGALVGTQPGAGGDQRGAWTGHPGSPAARPAR